MYIAIKELKKEKLRFGMILSVIVLISYLVYFLSSLAYGLSELNKTAIDHWNAGGVIVSEASNKNLYASVIDVEDVIDLESENVEFLTISNANAKVNGSESTSLVFMGYENTDSVIIPKLVEGKLAQDDFEVMVSSNIRDEFEVEVGDLIIISNTKREFTVTGFTEDSNYNTVPVVYANKEMVSEMMMNYDTSSTQNDANSTATPNMPNRISFILVKDRSQIDLSNLDDELRYIDIDTLIEALPGYTAQILTFGLMIISLAVIVSIIMGIFMYILTMQKKAIFAVLKIQGYQNKTIISSIVFQIILLVIIGLTIGFGLNQLTVVNLSSKVPLLLNVELIIYVSIFILFTSILGGLFSAYSVLKIDPLEAL